MNARQLAALRRKHDAHIDHVRARGGRVLMLEQLPCCGTSMDVHVPASKHETWDSLTTCPNCGELFFKVVTRNKAIAYGLPA